VGLSRVLSYAAAASVCRRVERAPNRGLLLVPADTPGVTDDTDDPSEPTVRPYRPDEDDAALWALKERFERELGDLGGASKARTYDKKLDDDYRERYLAWVKRCVTDEPCVLVAATPRTDCLAGYVFVLPERLAMVWDAAVVNELYVRPAHRSEGVADALFEGALAVVAEQSLPLDRVVLDVDGANERARAFYDRYGFDAWGELVAREL
jgi:ribosomal protein S18 acetylase RimI-like enzyme